LLPVKCVPIPFLGMQSQGVVLFIHIHLLQILNMSGAVISSLCDAYSMSGSAHYVYLKYSQSLQKSDNISLMLDIGKNCRTQQKLFIICYTMQLVSTQLWGHHQAMHKNWRNEMYMEVPYGIPFGLHWL
jgi:hypothetical protein